MQASPGPVMLRPAGREVADQSARHASRHPHVLDRSDPECGESDADLARVDV